MIFFMFLLAFLLYSFGAWFAYQNQLKASWFFIPVAVGISVAAGVLWGWISKSTYETNKLYFYGLVYDLILIICYTFLPMLWGVKLSNWSFFGLALACIGIILIKIHG